MEIYVATVRAKKGHEDDVQKFYVSQEEGLQSADGYRGRHLMREKPGTMRAALSKVIPAEQMAKHPAEESPGTQFIIVEMWDSVDAKTAYSRKQNEGRSTDLLPHLLPEHTHEYYEDITPK